MKGGFNYMAAALAVQLAPYKIRVNAIAPGLIRTPASTPIVDMPAIP